METKVLNTTAQHIDTAAEILKSGGLVAIPTETVYGLAANALNAQAVKNIFVAKGRAQDNPLIVHVTSIDEIKPLVTEIPEKVYMLAEKFWPGPLTMIMKKSDLVPGEVTCGMDTVAIRVPSHKVARDIISRSGLPLAAPSANISGGVSPTTAQHCIDDLTGRVDAIVDGGSCDVGLESTVILMCNPTPRLLRPGFITKEQIESVIGKIDVDDAILNPLKDGVKPSSPGMKYKHYSPNAKVVILEGDDKAYCDYVNQHADEGVFALCFDEDAKQLKVPCICYGEHKDEKTQAAKLFSALRSMDEKGAKLVFARMPKADGVGLAVVNRLLRAAAFQVINL
ncbi:MAG: threonylcarbamoyl-AMP synthase [Clostridia bacterium]|nr:threonylcarbamoyl-AMP synthase [Clostridia bacterium]